MNDDKTTEVTITDTSVSLLNKQDEEKVLQAIIKCKDRFELQKQLEAFKLNQAKKNAIQSVKMTECLGLIQDQIYKRIKTRPAEISNADAIKFVDTVSNQIDRANRLLDDAANDTATIRTINQKNDVTINLGTELNKENKENVVGAMRQILAILGNQQLPADPQFTPTSNVKVKEEEPEVEEVEVQPVPIVQEIKSENE